MKILFVGGTAFMGARAVNRLARLGHEVTVFHRGGTDRTEEGVRHLHGDRDALLDHREAFRALGPDVVVHMIAGTAQDAWTARRTFEGVTERLVLASSVDVLAAYDRLLDPVGGALEPQPLTDDSALRTRLFPRRAMAASIEDPALRARTEQYDKLVVESILQASPAFVVTTLRLPMVHGPDDPQRRFAAYLARMDAGRPALLLEEHHADWRGVRGFVDDMGYAIASAATTSFDGHRTFLVGESPVRTERMWIEAIARHVGYEGRIVTLPAERFPEAMRFEVDFRQHLDVDASAARSALGLPDPTPLDDQIAATVADERARGLPTPDYSDEDALLADVEAGGRASRGR